MLKSWFNAMYTMPRVGPAEWIGLDPLTKWLIASRAPVLIMTFTSCVIGGLLALKQGAFTVSHFTLALLGLLLAHASNNQLNDWTDSRRGVDKGDYFRNRYGTHVIEHGLMSATVLFYLFLVTLLLAFLAGVLLVFWVGGLTGYLMLAGGVLLLTYSYPLKAIGLGEIAVLIVWGPLMVGGTFYVSSGVWDWPAAWFGLLYALGPTAVLFSKHTDKLEADRQKRVYSLPVLLGERNALAAVVALLWAQYLGVIALIAYDASRWPLLLVFLNGRVLLRSSRVFVAQRPDHRPAEFPTEVWPLWYSAHAFDHTRRFSLLLMAALIAEVVLALMAAS